MAFGSILDLWNKWNIRGFVILSFSLQVFLIYYAPLRKKVANHCIIFLLRLAYLMADWVAAFTIGLISHNQGNSSTYAAELDGALQVFWASFLLLHLGGQDTIAGFYLEDNSLWERHLLSLVFQFSAAIYLLVQIFSSDKSLVIPTMLVLFAGLIKNVERTLALKLSSLSRLMESMLSTHSLPNTYESGEFVKELNTLREGHSNEEGKPLPESIVVKHAYYFFQIFKVFINDLMFKYDERTISRAYFCEVSAMDALRVISVELNFMYEVLHTKALVIRSKWSNIFRFIAFIDLVLAFVLFNRLKKHRLPKLDVEITYSLLFSGMTLDVIAFFNLIFSDWIVAGIKCFGLSKLDSFLHNLVSATYSIRKPRFVTCEVEPNANAMHEVLNTPFIFRRWSESILACNLLSEYLKESPRKKYKQDWSWGIIALPNIHSFLLRMAEKIILASDTIIGLCGPGKRLMIANTMYMSKNPFMKKLWIFIFREVKRKSKDVDTPSHVKQIFEARGDFFLKSMLTTETSDLFLAHVTETNYDNSIISWHIATEIWYNKEKLTVKKEEREFSKILSDYMLYLLLNQHNVVSVVAGSAQMMSAETLHELFLYVGGETKDIEEVCERLYGFPLLHSDFRFKSALGEGIKLANEMDSLGETKWEVMSGVWVEMLTYAAGHIRGEAHVEVLSKGGELLTFVWLLMAHFGCLYKPGWGICHMGSSYFLASAQTISSVVEVENRRRGVPIQGIDHKHCSNCLSGLI